MATTEEMWGTPTGTYTIEDHDASHEDGGADEISVEGLSGDLADLQDPKDHTHQSAGSGVGGKLDHGLALNGLTDDDHTQYVKHSLATAASDFLVGTAGAWVKKTLAETITVLRTSLDSIYEALGAVATHAALTTGVHGVGAGTVAKTSDITATKLDDFTAPDDNTDLDVSTSKHGLAPKAVAPAAGLINVYGIANAETAITNKALFDATVPSTQAFGDAAATGTAVVSARRDHKHAMPADPSLKSKQITVTRDLTAASGDVSYTGIGFTPTCLIVAAAVSGGDTANWGQIDQDRYGEGITYDENYAYNFTGFWVFFLRVAAGAYQYAQVKSYDADGFTLTWTKVGLPTGTGTYRVLSLR